LRFYRGPGAVSRRRSFKTAFKTHKRSVCFTTAVPGADAGLTFSTGKIKMIAACRRVQPQFSRIRVQEQP
jgi:hypothetical protein